MRIKNGGGADLRDAMGKYSGIEVSSGAFSRKDGGAQPNDCVFNQCYWCSTVLSDIKSTRYHIDNAGKYRRCVLDKTKIEHNMR